ncbi:MAG: phosphonate ABC transporter, permease protein PhnE [Dehalococcoidia bacterium]
MNRRSLITRAAFAALALLTLFSMRRIGLLELDRIRPAGENLGDFVSSLFPPDLDVLGTLIEAMIETVEIAFVGTILGVLLSLPLALLATRTLFEPVISLPARMLISAFRTVPSLLWGVIWVIAYGLGPEAGALGVACYSVGFLGKLYYESFEAVDSEVMEAVRGAGTNRMQLIIYAVLPESTNSLVSHLLFMFEYNIRASTIMGFVGAGGIGFYMLGYIQLLRYESLMTALLLTFVVVTAVDLLSGRIRALLVPSVQQQSNRSPLRASITALNP